MLPSLWFLLFNNVYSVLFVLALEKATKTDMKSGEFFKIFAKRRILKTVAKGKDATDGTKTFWIEHFVDSDDSPVIPYDKGARERNRSTFQMLDRLRFVRLSPDSADVHQYDLDNFYEFDKNGNLTKRDDFWRTASKSNYVYKKDLEMIGTEATCP